MKLKDATFEDWEFLLDLRNDESTKKNSFNGNLILEEEHKNWLRNSLKNKNRKIKILFDSVTEKKMGMIREDHLDDRC